MLLSKLSAFLLALSMSVSAADVDMDYEGEIDIITGRPAVSENAENSVSSQQTVAVSDTVTYDRKSHLFSYALPNTSGVVQSNVADGMITTSPVNLIIPNGVSVSLYRNGEVQDDTDPENIVTPGGYAVVVTQQDFQQQILSFTIVSELTNSISLFQMPSGFQLTRLDIDGMAQTVNGQTSVDMTEDGKYRIAYRCIATGIDYNLNVEVDHTPPAVILDGVVNGYAQGPVTISGFSKEDKVEVTSGGEKVTLINYTLKSPGTYHISVKDKAGNTLEQDFEIQFYLNSQGLIFTLLTVAVAVAVFLYMYISKKRLKVR